MDHDICFEVHLTPQSLRARCLRRKGPIYSVVFQHFGHRTQETKIGRKMYFLLLHQSLVKRAGCIFAARAETPRTPYTPTTTHVSLRTQSTNTRSNHLPLQSDERRRKTGECFEHLPRLTRTIVNRRVNYHMFMIGTHRIPCPSPTTEI